MILEAFEVHQELNPKIWSSDNTLRPEVHDKILEIVNAFKEYIDIPLDISDICIVGSNASYNYHDTSDLDVHIISNFELIQAPSELVQSAYNNARASFKNSLDISIHGINVELYVEDIKTNAVSNGVYSVLNNRWIKFPSPLGNIQNFDTHLDIEFWKKKTENAIASNDKDAIAKVLSDIYLMRKNSLSLYGEYSKGNQIFKELRDLNIIAQLRDAYNQCLSKDLSLEALTEDAEPLDEEKLEEDSVHKLLTQSKSTEKGAERFKNRVKSKIKHTPKQYNQIDMNKLFKDGILTVDVEVQGEHDNYIVRMSYGGFLDILHDQTKKLNPDEKVDLKMITKTLITGFNRGDLYIHCSCDDFKYRYNYWVTKKGINSGDPESRPANQTNPDDDMGCGCKHVLLALTNTAWILKSSVCVYNYILYMEKHEEKLYKKIIYPAIYNREYEEPVEEVPSAEEQPSEEIATEKATN